MSEISCMQSQQNSAAQTVHVMWLHEPSSIFTIRAPQRGHDFMSPAKTHASRHGDKTQNSMRHKLINADTRKPQPCTNAQCRMCVVTS